MMNDDSHTPSVFSSNVKISVSTHDYTPRASAPDGGGGVIKVSFINGSDALDDKPHLLKCSPLQRNMS